MPFGSYIAALSKIDNVLPWNSDFLRTLLQMMCIALCTAKNEWRIYRARAFFRTEKPRIPMDRETLFVTEALWAVEEASLWTPTVVT